MAIGAVTPRDQLDRLLALVRRAFRYWWVTGIVGVLGTALALAFALSRPRQYESSTVIMYQEVISARLLQGGDAAGGHSRNMAIRFREMIMARPLLQKVIEELDLYQDVIEDEGMTAAVEEMRLAIQFGTRGGGTFMISYRGSTPEEAQAVTAKIADLLITWEKELQLERASMTKDFLDQQSMIAEEELRTRERELAEFLAAHPEFAAEDAVGNTPGAGIRAAQSSSKSTPKDPTLRALERQRDRIEARLAASEGRPPPRPQPREPSPELRRAEEDVRNARRELSEAEAELARQQSRYTERHPDVVAAKGRVATAKKRVDAAEAEAARLAADPLGEIDTKPPSEDEKAALENELREINKQIAAYKRRAAGSKDEGDKVDEGANRVVLLETEFQRLRRGVDESRERAEAIESKAFTAEMVAASELATQGSQLSIVEPAHLPTRPAGVGRSVLVLLGMVAFGAIGVALALGLALVDDRIVSKYDVERLEILPVLAVVPKISKKKRSSFGA